MAQHQGIEIKPRDVQWLSYLSYGPARIPEAEKIYINPVTKEPLPRQLIHRRLKKLEESGFIRKYVYKNIKRAIMYYIDQCGIQELATYYNFEVDYIRFHPTPPAHIVHEISLTSVIRRLHKDSLEGGLYNVLYYYDDRMLKNRRRKHKKADIKKKEVFPDLETRIEPLVGSAVTLSFEIEGIHITERKFKAKLAGLDQRTNYMVIVMTQDRLERLYRYTEACNKRPEEVYFTTINDFNSGGLTGTFWLHYPSKKKLRLVFK